MGGYFVNYEIQQLPLYLKNTVLGNLLNVHYIVYHNSIILTIYKKYREEQTIYQLNKHYSILWGEQNIYK